MFSVLLPHALGVWEWLFPKAQKVKRKQNFFQEFRIFLTTELDGAAVQMGQVLSFSSLSSSSALSKKRCFFTLVPDQLVAFKEKTICFTVVSRKMRGKKNNPQSKTKNTQPSNQPTKKLKTLIAIYPEKAKNSRYVRQQDSEKNTVKFNMVLFTLLISEFALNMLFFFKGNIKLSHQINAQSPIHITRKAPAGLTAAQFMNLSHLQSSRNALHSFLYACAYLVVLMLLTGPFIMACKVFLTNCCVGYCLHWNIYAFSCRSETPAVHSVNWRL